ncbi:MAG: hypothetical protein JOZ16_10465 [Methylobacteriaceae bacterium]|nr:hypothetical protein [Methylobacteriaceae bacterium]
MVSNANKLRTVAITASLLIGATYAQAYDYVDSRGYRHWCQSSCASKGIHVPKPGEEAKAGETNAGEVQASEVVAREVDARQTNTRQAKRRERRAVDESNLAWEPPPGVKWQIVPQHPSQEAPAQDEPARADASVFTPNTFANKDTRQ